MDHTPKQDEEETYWFLRWIAMRYERNKLKSEIDNFNKIVYGLNKKIKGLENNLKEIKTDYQPIKTKIHNGYNKKNK